MNKNESIGDRIRQVRGEATQRDFAVLLDIGLKTLSRYENNERQPDADLLIKLNVLYGVQPLWLLTGKGPDSDIGLTPKEAYVLSNYRMLSQQKKQALEQMLSVLTAQADLLMVAEEKTKYEGSQQTFKSKVGQVAGRDIVNTTKGKKK